MSAFWQTTLYQAAGSFNHFYERMLGDREEGPKETMEIGLANAQEQYMSTICVSIRFSDFVLVLAPGFLSCFPKVAIEFITLVT